VIYSAGDLGVEIDLGADEPGALLQRKEPGGGQDYRVSGKRVSSRSLIDVQSLVTTLPAGYYRLVAESLRTAVGK
jgi:hypothetical protein